MNDFREDDALHLAALLCTRLCHDMAGPVGAIGAGVELLDDDAPIEESVSLLRQASGAATAKLKFLRAAFGLRGSAAKGGEAETLLADYVKAAGGSIRLEWDLESPSHALESPRVAQLVLVAALAALDVLKGRGTIRISIDAASEQRLFVAAEGPRAALEKEAGAALSGTVCDFSARSVPFYMLRLLAKAFGGVKLSEEKLSEERRSVCFSCVIPSDCRFG